MATLISCKISFKYSDEKYSLGCQMLEWLITDQDRFQFTWEVSWCQQEFVKLWNLETDFSKIFDLSMFGSEEIKISQAWSYFKWNWFHFNDYLKDFSISNFVNKDIIKAKFGQMLSRLNTEAINQRGKCKFLCSHENTLY